MVNGYQPSKTAKCYRLAVHHYLFYDPYPTVVNSLSLHLYGEIAELLYVSVRTVRIVHLLVMGDIASEASIGRLKTLARDVCSQCCI